VYELEKKGIPAVCKMHGIDPEDLGVKGCLLIYRRRKQDMPLAQPPENATLEATCTLLPPFAALNL
jgi:hypothetical protein